MLQRSQHNLIMHFAKKNCWKKYFCKSNIFTNSIRIFIHISFSNQKRNEMKYSMWCIKKIFFKFDFWKASLRNCKQAVNKEEEN